MFGPVMSASSRPTVAPACASATARLTLTVDLPDAALARRHGDDVLDARHELLGLARLRAADHRAPGDLDVGRAESQDRAGVLASISSLSGQAGVVSSMVNATRRVLDGDRLDHLERHDVAPELWLLDVRGVPSRTAPSVMVVMRRSASFCHGKCRNTSYPACGQRPRGSFGVMPAREPLAASHC